MKKLTLLRKLISIGLAAVISIALLAGCSAEETKTDSGVEETKTETASTENSKTEEKVEIEFFQQKTEAVDTYNKIIEKFQAENPNITVLQNNIPDSRNVLLSRMASGDMPDVFSAYPNESDFKVQANEGYMMDLTGQAFLENANADVLNSVKISGKDYSLPISMNTVGVYYNIKMFKDLNIEVPKTFEELIAAAEKIKAAGIVPFALSDKDAWTVGIQANIMTGELMDAEVVPFFEGVTNGEKTTKDNEVMNTVADRILELRNYGTEDAAAIGYDQAIAMFATEKTAMFINGIWAIPSVQKANPDIEFAMFPLPATTEEGTKVIYGIDAAVSISATTEHKEAALKFVEFLARPDVAQIFADNDKSPSVITGVTMNFEPIKLLVDKLNENKSFQWLHFKWAAGMEGQWNTEAQMLAVTKDKEAYLTNLDKIFMDSKTE